jgi:hypothetical protein
VYGRAVIDFFLGSLATGESFHEDNKRNAYSAAGFSGKACLVNSFSGVL